MPRSPYLFGETPCEWGTVDVHLWVTIAFSSLFTLQDNLIRCDQVWSTGHLTFGRSAQKLLCSEFLCSPLHGPQQLDKVLHLSDLKNISSKRKLTQIKPTAAFLFTWAKLVHVVWRRQSCCYKCVFLISHWIPIWKCLSPLFLWQWLYEGMLFVQFTLSVRTKGVHDG